MTQSQACALGSRRRCGEAHAYARATAVAMPVVCKVVGPRPQLLPVRVITSRKVFRLFRSSPHCDDEDSVAFDNNGILDDVL